jgi:hypothetical protein
MALNFALTIMYSIQYEVVALVLGAIVWLMFSINRVPTIDPYVPRSKRPPLYLEQFLTWLNTSIDLAVTNLAPRIIVCRSTTTYRPFLKQSAESGRPSDHFYQAHQRFNYAMRLIWRIISCKRHFNSWRSRHRFTKRRQLLAMSAAGIARAHQAASATDSNRVIFDSDSFDILVDGGATSCISNNL